MGLKQIGSCVAELSALVTPSVSGAPYVALRPHPTKRAAVVREERSERAPSRRARAPRCRRVVREVGEALRLVAQRGGHRWSW